MHPRVLITRERAEPLEGLLKAGGLETVHVPLVVLQATHAPAPEPVPEVVVITSAAVVRFVPDLADRVRGVPVAAVGRATAEALQGAGVTADHVGHAGGASLIEGLESAHAHLWYIGAAAPSSGVQAALAAHAGLVDVWSVYDNHLPDGAGDALSRAQSIDLVTLTSPSAARRYAALAGAAAVPVAVLGQSTAAEARAQGLSVTVEPDSPGLKALAAAILRG